MENAERAKRVLDDMQTRFDKEDYAGVANLKEDIEMCLHVCAEDSTCAEIACLFATAMHADCGYTLAIYYFEFAFCLQTGLKLAPLAAASDPSRPRRGAGSLSGRDILQPPDDVMSAFTGDSAKTQRDNLTMARVCGGMGNACAAVGAFAEAQPWFVQCVELRKHIESAPAAMLQYVFMVAQNLHALRRHQEAIQMVHAALKHAQRAGSEGHYSDDVSNYDVAYKSPICPTLLLGRCYTAIGKYNLALECLQQACAQANETRDPTFMVTAHLEFAVTGWAYQKCLDVDVIKKSALYRDGNVFGPPLSRTMVQRHVVQLAAADCIKAHGAGGVTDMCILLNANGDPVCVRRFHVHDNDPQIDLVVKVHWGAVDSVQLDHATAPLLLSLQIQGPDRSMHTFDCVFVRSVPFVLGDAGSSESRQCTVAGVGAEHISLTDFLTRCVSLTQIGDAEERAQGMAIVTAALTKARRLTWEHNLVELQEDSLIFLCFCGIDVGVGEEKIFRSLKKFLQSQVDAAKEPNPKCLTCKQACTAVCGGCTVMRFCDKNHQRQSSSMPFFSTKVRHKMMCPLLFLCKSLSRSRVRPDAGGTEAVQLAQQYDEALRQFLRTDFFGQYVKNSDFELD